MWVEETKKGKYKYIERYTDPLTGKYRRVSVVLDKNTAQARKQAQRALEEKIRQAESWKPANITLGELVKKYREEQKKTIKASTYSRNYSACNSIMEILGADSIVNKLNAGYVRESFLATGKAPVTLNEFLTRFKALMRWGYRNDYVSDISYLDKLEKFRDIPHRIKIEGKFLESSELSALLNGMTVKKWKDLTEFLSLSGLRFGEAAALDLPDVDLKSRLIHVSKTYDAAHDIVTSTKTATSTRDVYMQDQLYQLCRRLKAERLSDNIVLPMSVVFFPGSKRERIEFDCYAKYLRENSERIIGRRITPHTLRHTHASLLMEQGIDMVNGFLGYWFIRKCLWSTPDTVRSCSASIKKFYKSMLARGKVSQDAYDMLVFTIKNDLEDWMDSCY